jgi:predicted nucleic acid-binding protein
MSGIGKKRIRKRKNMFLIDTCIWVDLYEDRKGYQKEPLADYAFKLFCNIKASEDKIVITDLTIRELEMTYSIEEIKGMMKPFEDMIENLISSKQQREEAKRIAQLKEVPKGDALHAIIARDNNLILITRDKHFNKLTNISLSYKPEEII